ncbi:MAG: hypothetical protein ACI9VS_002242 [Candidatus Binatia bacterium]
MNGFKSILRVMRKSQTTQVQTKKGKQMKSNKKRISIPAWVVTAAAIACFSPAMAAIWPGDCGEKPSDVEFDYECDGGEAGVTECERMWASAKVFCVAGTLQNKSCDLKDVAPYTLNGTYSWGICDTVGSSQTLYCTQILSDDLDPVTNDEVKVYGNCQGG